MAKTTVIEEFDADGNLVKKTTITESPYNEGGYVNPTSPNGGITINPYPSVPWTITNDTNVRLRS